MGTYSVIDIRYNTVISYIYTCHREIGKEDEDDEDYADDDDDNMESAPSLNTKPSMSDQKVIGT